MDIPRNGSRKRTNTSQTEIQSESKRKENDPPPPKKRMLHTKIPEDNSFLGADSDIKNRSVALATQIHGEGVPSKVVVDFCDDFFAKVLEDSTHKLSTSCFNTIPQEQLIMFFQQCEVELGKRVTSRKKDLEQLLKKVDSYEYSFNDIPDWYDVRSLITSQEDNFSEHIIEDLKLLSTLPNNLKTMYEAIKNSYNSEEQLASELVNHAAFKNFPTSELWRLFIDGTHQLKRGKFGYENEPGYLNGCYNGFRFALEMMRTPRKLDANHLAMIHDITVDQAYLFAHKKMQLQPHLKGFRTQVEKHPECRLSFSAIFGLNASREGLNEMLSESEQISDDIYKHKKFLYEFRYQKGAYGLSFLFSHIAYNKKTEDIINALFENCYAALDDKSKSSYEKERAIALCASNLERMHLFHDANCRTNAFIVTNILRIYAGLYPIIWPDPNTLDAFSLEQLVEIQQKGCEEFLSFCTAKN